ncbi:hypothetical protein [Faecalicoccus acidiformans]
MKQMPFTKKYSLIHIIGEFPNALAFYKLNFVDSKQIQKMTELDINDTTA